MTATQYPVKSTGARAWAGSDEEAAPRPRCASAGNAAIQAKARTT
jgi:hypothetical protein